MTGAHSLTSLDLAAQMRDEFDAGFARPATRVETEQIDLLELRVGDRHVDLAVADVAQVVARPELIALPTTVGAFSGLVGVGDLLVAGYDLGVLLGLPPAGPGWLLTAALEPTVGVTLDQVVAHRRVPRQGARTLPLLVMADLLEQIRTLAAQPHRSQE